MIVSNINIDYRDKPGYNKHRLAKGLCGIHFEQLVDFIRRPVSKDVSGSRVLQSASANRIGH